MLTDQIELREIQWDADADRKCRRYLVLNGLAFPGQVIHHYGRSEYQWSAVRWDGGSAFIKFQTQDEAVQWVITGRYEDEVAA